LGFLVGEGILRSPEEVHHAAHDPAFCRSGESSNVLLVQLAAGVDRDTERLRRHFYTSSSCGVCGKGSLEAVRAVLADAGAGNPEPDPTYPCWDAAIIRNLPKRLRGLQGTFRRTGGLHAAALVAQDGRIVLAREDVGRHNAVDKLIGHAFMAGLLPLKDHLLLLSGRASFELVQKAIAAGIPGIAAVGAPSTLAVDLAMANGRTLLGFVRDQRFNCYAGPGRLQADHATSPAPPA
jgi:FdhD protein